MSVNREKISQLVRTVDILIQTDHSETSLDENSIEGYLQKALAFLPVSFDNEELAEARREIAWKYQIRTTPGQSILADYDQDNWYDDRKSEIDSKFWTRYRDYLIDEKHFSPSVVSTLGDDTLDRKLMNYVLDPILRRIYNVWEKYYSFAEFTWEKIADAMFAAVENIQIKVVNSSKLSERLEYPKEGNPVSLL